MKRRPLRRRFWVELCAAVTALLLLAAWIVNPTWIESATGLDPDAGSGAVEWLLTVLAAAVAAGSSLLARAEVRLRAAAVSER
jgi:hypothetical protein